MSLARLHQAGALLVASLLLVLTTAPGADAACNATCKRDVARCMATQCEGIPRAACRRHCKPAAIRTLAYALSECRVDAAGTKVWRQALRIRRGDREPITVVEFGPSESTQDRCMGLSSLGGQGYGNTSMFFFPLQRLGVSPDAATIVFEVNDEFLLFGPPTLSPDQKGFFLVRSDGRGLRRLGPASRDPSFNLGGSLSPPIVFSPNGRRIAFTDRGPGPGGEEAVQIVVLDLATGERTQVTRLPTGTPPPVIVGLVFPFLTCCPTFVDNETVLFQTYVDPDGSNPEHNFAAFTVRIDGGGLKPVPMPVVLPGSQVVPTFGVTGLRTNLVRLSVPGTAEGPPWPPGTSLRVPISEVFFRDGKTLLQLTNFRLPDTFIGFVDTRRMRAFFLASADPLGTNPTHNCQMFSIDTSGSGLRQVTHFEPPQPFDFSSFTPGCFWYGCFLANGQTARLGCGIGGNDIYRAIFQDPVTEAVVLDSSCDPLRTNSVGEQIFAMRPDGHGLRELTDAAGLTTNPDGSTRVELPGPYAYSGIRP